jgi:hypothetical protein
MSMRSFFFFVAALARSISGWASAIGAFTYVVFGGQKVPLERPRVRTREGEHPLASLRFSDKSGVDGFECAPRDATLVDST